MAGGLKGEIEVKVPIGKRFILKNGKQIDHDTRAIIKEDRTYLPIRIVMETFGATVGWNAEKREVVITSPIDKNIYTSDFLEVLVNNTECSEEVLAFRESKNSRRNGLLKMEGKYFDMYYPDDDYGQEVADFLKPHMDKSYMMLTDIYGLQAKVEVHLIHEEDAMNLKEGNIRGKENVTFIWLEPNNDDGGNNLSEFVHEINHNFFDQANGGSTNVMWINEANAKLVPSLYIKDNYVGPVEMHSFYTADNLLGNLQYFYKTLELSEDSYKLKRANELLRVARAWGREEGEKLIAQNYGLFLWSYIYNNHSLEEYKYFLRNLGTKDVEDKLEVLLNKTSEKISAEILDLIKINQ